MKFEGLIIGGPTNGQMYTHDSPRYRVPALEKMPPVFFDVEKESAREKTVANVFEYELISGIRFGGSKAVDFWVPVGKNAEWAITELLAAYQRLPKVEEALSNAEQAIEVLKYDLRRERMD